MRRLLPLLLLTAALPTAAPAQDGGIPAAVADGARPDADKARDADRKPATMLAFAGIAPGMTVAELAPGGGYYTRLLAKAVGPKGQVFAVVSTAASKRPGGLDAINAIAAAYPNVKVVVADLGSLAIPAPADAVWTSENYHDFHNSTAYDIASANKAVFSALKPGGVFYVEDHAAPGTGIAATSTLHRIDPAAAKSELAAAGFAIEAESTALANAADAHTLGVTDPAIRGKTDRFALRARKPK